MHSNELVDESSSTGAPILEPQVVTRSLVELRPHRSYLHYGFTVSVAQLSTLGKMGERAFWQPITITQEGTILDGYARCELARRQGRKTILCLAYNLTKADELCWLIQSHCPSPGWDAYSRTLLGHDLEPYLEEKARANKSIGGQKKDSAILTEAQRIDVRSEISSTTGVSAGNLTKVKHLRKDAHPNVERALRNGKVSIHKAWCLSQLPRLKQVRELKDHQSQKGVNKTSCQLIRKHVAELSPLSAPRSTLAALVGPLSSERPSALASIAVAEIDSPGKVAYFTKEALRTVQTWRHSDEQIESPERDPAGNQRPLGST